MDHGKQSIDWMNARGKENRRFGAADFQMDASGHLIGRKRAKHARQLIVTVGAGAWFRLVTLFERVRIEW